RLAARWLATDFTIVGREWAYRDVRRAVYIEELLRDDGGGLPADFKLFAFDGEVRLIQVDRDRYGHHTQVLYDPQWRPIEGTVAAAPGAPVAAPVTLPRMIDAARTLAAGIDFLRVDFYEIAGRIVFGELTNYPNKGLNRFEPASLDALLGSWLMLAPTRPVAIAYRPGSFSGT
ncbi:MAG: ATP-grasp fold amidoligase family protein, partial [Candidatus Levyibacteriota bacterium]